MTSKALLIPGLIAGSVAGAATILPLCNRVLAAPEQAAPNQNQTAPFPDIQNHWAQPFIETLAAQDIIAGYLDGTFRPENPVARDEFAAMVRQSFNQEAERQLESGSVYEDVPTDYWAAPAIEEAAEMGFMQGYPDGTFRPNDSISRVEAISTLASNLNLAASAPSSAEATQDSADTPQATTPTRSARRRAARNPFPFPLALTYFMAPVVASPARVQPQSPTPAAPAPSPEAQAADPQTEPAQSPTPLTINDYYVDADQIPQPATENVLAATKAGVVVNHPDPQVLNPNRPATRGEVAALIHQALVTQGRLEPLPDDTAATNYIVGGS
ncbi:S-layer homology domain-containing protein [Leptolyngbya sp. NK1-12]|uniref:S-layer homology domain-containing protein n=1 Tax=Leptolyngbya sp. NK1-12 TaxID=2547451 RepID=UPI00292E35FE|nr:S-layer homology domain-containing protein [Leptolyngbya sp. NK1-12]